MKTLMTIEGNAFDGFCGILSNGVVLCDQKPEDCICEINAAYRAAVKKELEAFMNKATREIIVESNDKTHGHHRGFYRNAASVFIDKIESIDIDAFLEREEPNGKGDQV